MKLIINWKLKRAKHAIERSVLRGISQNEFRIAILKGRKVRQMKNIYEAFARYYSVVYEEKFYMNQNVRKINPITVKLW
ncbi:MAG: hypothetical protein AB1779_02735 [Candidatus Thermoplasmatota archaeon]